MNTFHARGRGISSQETPSTTGKNTANSTEGKTTMTGSAGRMSRREASVGASRPIYPGLTHVCNSPRRSMTRCAVLWCCVLLLAAVASADAQAPGPTVSVSTKQIGWMALHLTGTPGATVTVTETTPAGPVAVASVVLPAGGVVDLPRAAPWRCDTPAPAFTAVFT